MIPDDGVAPLAINGVDGRHRWLCIDGICVAQMHRMNPALTLYEAVNNAEFF
jgi:hypothetical protein